jgi:ABC-2 type transport system ATP-binding protein
MVDVEQLIKRYRGAQRNAVDGVSFDVGAGEFFALLGPNGAGKSTTVSILTTTLAPTSGRVHIAGCDLRTDPAAVRKQVGIIFQNPSLDMNLSGEENIRLHAVMYGLYPYRPAYRLMSAKYRQQIGEIAAVLGMETDMFQPVRKLSGGMRRKLEIMRALLHRPQVLFLDEPTTGLDVASRRSLWAYLAEIRQRQETTIVLTTHYLEEAETADRILILDHGRVVAQGSPAQIKAQFSGATLTLDAADRAALRRELNALGTPFEEHDGFHIALDGRLSAHELTRTLTTPLTVIQTQQASLEEVYLRILANDDQSS